MATHAETDEPGIETPEPVAVSKSLLANAIIKDHMMACMAISVVPVPLLDVAGMAGVQIRMIKKLSDLYDKSFSEKTARNIVSGLAGGVIGVGTGAIAAVSLSKLIPGVGTLLGIATMPVVAAGTTYAIGQVFLKHYETDGDMYDLSVEAARDYYKSQLARGKDLAGKVKRTRQEPVAE
ncbi:DUF697 domain-containing protein [Rhizobium lemnae]|uniref:YcjF family protein n=1 Tax=Rhizobium lemnae TaxID=1214924 RepID=A0ABV8EH49_9HYPH|nr:DUF697 domain-containing protein [Rhizobium lemnae]MCJ8509924.1 DUF697 domain-containing protein [Rhizobium lemnae]